MHKIHLDTDLGGDPDDLCALALLLAWPDVEITGVTTVADKGGQRAGYVRFALDLAGRPDIPVAAGPDAAHSRFPVVFPNEAAYWPQPVSPLPAKSADEALSLLKNSMNQGATIVGIGPFTNLAAFDRAYPDLLARVPLVLMGGFVYPIPAGFPQWERDADWNVQSDVAAARHILERLRPTLVPLEVSVQTALRRGDLPRLRESGPLAALIARQAEAHAVDEGYEAKYGLINFHHDPLACAVALGWEGATVTETPLRLEMRGEDLSTLPDPAGRPTKVVTAVDGAGFNEFWLDLVCATGWEDFRCRTTASRPKSGPSSTNSPPV